MNYQEAIDFIHSRERFGIKPGLSNMERLMDRLLNVHDKLKIIHVAGTNGKGSTSMFIANTLIKNNYKTGIYISPFVHNFEERIQINNEDISKSDVAKYTTMVADVITPDLGITEFEVVTAVAFLYFFYEKCDFVVLEVGLGGRFDATNIIKNPIASVITSISFDHTDYLGDTLEKIAFEKCGIIKKGSTVIGYCDNPPSVNEVITNTAGDVSADVIIGDKADIKIISQDINGSKFLYKNNEYFISMLGTHQILNAVTAINVCEFLKIDLNIIKEGLKSASFSGRFEVLKDKHNVIVDGAHNFGGISALKDTLKTHFKDKKIIIVMGMLKDKEYEKCVAEMASVASLFIAAEPNNKRRLTHDELCETAKKYNKNAVSFKNLGDAMAYAYDNADDDTVICVCGSLYLIGGV